MANLHWEIIACAWPITSASFEGLRLDALVQALARNTPISMLEHHYKDATGERAAMQAGLKANGALEAGDTFNHQLWQRVAMAVQELERTNAPGKALN